MLEEGVSDHRHERVTMKTLPGPPFELVEAKFLFQLLMGLLAGPSGLDCGSQVAQVHLGWFSRQALLTDEPSLITWKMLLRATSAKPSIADISLHCADRR